MVICQPSSQGSGDRIMPDMEMKLIFLISQVRFVNQKWHQIRFQKNYLATTESQTLRCDIIRFLCFIHPVFRYYTQVIILQRLSVCILSFIFLIQTGTTSFMVQILNQNRIFYTTANTATLLDFYCRIVHNTG